MISISVKKQGNFSVSAKKIKDFLREYFQKSGIVSDAEVSVAIVGKEKMLNIQKRYFREDDPTSPFGFRGASKNLHNVLSFTEDEMHEKFVYPPDGKVYLGEIILCYPKIFEEAKIEGKMIEEKVLELIEHGADHLLGKHHE